MIIAGCFFISSESEKCSVPTVSHSLNVHQYLRYFVILHPLGSQSVSQVSESTAPYVHHLSLPTSTIAQDFLSSQRQLSIRSDAATLHQLLICTHMFSASHSFYVAHTTTTNCQLVIHVFQENTFTKQSVRCYLDFTTVIFINLKR